MHLPEPSLSPGTSPSDRHSRSLLADILWLATALALAVFGPVTSAATVGELSSLLGTSQKSDVAAAPQGAPCGAGTPNIIIHDDGLAENGYSFNVGSGASEGRLVDKFTPSIYPATFSSVCFAFVAVNLAITTIHFDIVVYAADGDDGSPGTLLA